MQIQQNIKVAVDAVVFGYREKQLQVLLIKRKLPPIEGAWALPGGFVRDQEGLEAAVERELQEETNVAINYLEQLYTYGDPKRDSRFRVISVAYFALVRPDQFELSAATDALEARWYPLNAIPKLAFDHSSIIAYALERLRNKLTYNPIGFDLLDREFPFSALETLYATVLDRAIDRRNFRKKIMSFGILEELPKVQTHVRGRPAALYRFNKKRYFQLLKHGFLFELR
jgi:8-oxo-dGTP diphosphatase